MCDYLGNDDDDDVMLTNTRAAGDRHAVHPVTNAAGPAERIPVTHRHTLTLLV